ncbi:MAG: glutathione peroxidase [Nitrospiraceae bacterium]|nr:glutathione peroxidase [Nitrospiraceae bacterium]MCW5781798.1 glutathione peroxidase [Nitrospirales bacterium]
MPNPNPFAPRYAFLASLCGLAILGGCGQDYTTPLGEAVANEPPPQVSPSDQQPSKIDITKDKTPSQIYDFIMEDIENKPRSLSEFKGQVIMIVNTASFCGNTPQYAGLQTLYERYRDQGFTILAFPANDFGKQEPGDNKEIAEFCYTKYSLEFPLFSKITVLGEQKHPLYRYLTEDTNFKGEITWNFQKFLINRKGTVIARYDPRQKPLSPEIVNDIENTLQSS